MEELFTFTETHCERVPYNFVSFHRTERGLTEFYQKSNGAISSSLPILYDVWRNRRRIQTKMLEIGPFHPELYLSAI